MLEGVVVNYDLTVRDSDNSVIQFQVSSCQGKVLLTRIRSDQKLFDQRWVSQRIKIHRLAYRFSIDFEIHTLAYGFFCVNHKDLAKVSRLLVRGFFLEIFS
jgi:hypothetical protein